MILWYKMEGTKPIVTFSIFIKIIEALLLPSLNLANK